ncbi:MAG TPA: hypothetical protein VKT81_18005 [Bryobacteraceae bacterium]|nr:hypothetical protein [Bryobacteraceae bacterium]
MVEALGVPCTPGSAYWNQRFTLQQAGDRLLSLRQTVGLPVDLSGFQWAQLFALALEFQPDVIIELGRGYGNSTCVFTEAAHRLPNPCHVISLGDCATWDHKTIPRLRSIVDQDWFRPLEAPIGDILTFDFEKALAGKKRVLIFWDAHGFDVAEHVLGTVLRLIQNVPHIVALHDMSDLRYCGEPDAKGEYAVWKGSDSDEGRFCLGNVMSKVPQAISVIDFTARNRLTFDSADHSIHTTIGNDPAKLAEMQAVLGPELFSTKAFWFWFTLNEHPGPYKFPRAKLRGEVTGSQ